MTGNRPGAHGDPPGPRRAHLIAIGLLGGLLFGYPLLAVFDVPGIVWGVPVLAAYLFLAWAAVVTAVAIVMRRPD